MAANLTKLASVLQELEPRFSMEQCTVLAAEVARITKLAADEDLEIGKLKLGALSGKRLPPLRLELRKLREAAGLSQEAAARAIGWSVTKLIRIETNGVGIDTANLRYLLSAYRVPRTTRDQLELMLEEERAEKRRRKEEEMQSDMPS